MNSIRRFTVLGALVLPFALALIANGCKKDEEEELPPPASTTTTPAPTTTTTMTLTTEEDAGADAEEDADASDGGKKLGTGDPTGIRRCCQALRQNVNSAPPEQKGAYIAAASACDGLVNSPQGRQALGTLRGILMGAQMPAACQ